MNNSCSFESTESDTIKVSFETYGKSLAAIGSLLPKLLQSKQPDSSNFLFFFPDFSLLLYPTCPNTISSKTMLGPAAHLY